MRLTERRKQFLGQILKLYDKTHLPVHYAAIAELLGVSKWTAYDVFRELERQGYLLRDYAINPGEPGRSAVVFMPTNRAWDLFKQASSDLSGSEEWAETRVQILRILDRLKDQGPNVVIQDILESISRIEVRITFCAYILALLLVHLRSLGETARILVKRLVDLSTNPEMGLTMFVGVAMGTALKTASIGLSLDLVDLAGRFLSDLSSLGTDKSQLLFDLVGEALQQPS